jgi:hypothetical protein
MTDHHWNDTGTSLLEVTVYLWIHEKQTEEVGFKNNPRWDSESRNAAVIDVDFIARHRSR